MRRHPEDILADLGAHLAAHAIGFFGGIVVCVLSWRKRRKPAVIDVSLAGSSD